VINFNNSNSDIELNIQEDFFDDLPEDILDNKSKKSIIPKSSQEKKSENIEQLEYFSC